MSSYAQIVALARDLSPVFTDLVMTDGQAKRILHKIAWQVTAEARNIDQRFLSITGSIGTGTANLKSIYGAALLTAPVATGLMADYFPSTGQEAVLLSLASPDNRVPLTVVPWADRLRPWGQYPITVLDDDLWLLGSEETWADVGQLNYWFPTSVLLTTVPTTLVQPESMMPALVCLLAEAMAVRAVGMELKVPLEVFVRDAETAKATFLAQVAKSGRSRTKLIRDVGP